MAKKTKKQQMEEHSAEYNELYLRAVGLEQRLTGNSGAAKKLLLEYAQTILDCKEVVDRMNALKGSGTSRAAK